MGFLQNSVLAIAQISVFEVSNFKFILTSNVQNAYSSRGCLKTGFLILELRNLVLI